MTDVFCRHSIKDHVLNVIFDLAYVTVNANAKAFVLANVGYWMGDGAHGEAFSIFQIMANSR